MMQLTAVEHEWLKIGEGRDIAPSAAEALAAAENVLPKACLQWGYRRVKFTQFCGVVQTGGLQIEILPKTFPHQTETEQRSALLAMLARTNELASLHGGKAGLATSQTKLLDVFIRHFIQLLERQLQQGLLQDYRDIDDTLDQVRGRIDLVRQQRENLFKPQRMALRFDELVEDIPINRLLNSTLRLLPSLTKDPLLKQSLRGVRQRFAQVGLLTTRENAPKVNDLNRMQKRYETLVQLSHLFLAGHFLDVRTGSHQVFCLLFDMNRLFERYTASVLRPFARHHGLRLIEQGPRRYLAEDETGKRRVLMRPDITLIDPLYPHTPILIVDTKWKLLDSKTTAAINTADLYQLSTYASTYKCCNVALLYPHQPSLSADSKHELSLHLPKSPKLSIFGVPLNGKPYDMPFRAQDVREVYG